MNFKLSIACRDEFAPVFPYYISINLMSLEVTTHSPTTVQRREELDRTPPMGFCYHNLL